MKNSRMLILVVAVAIAVFLFAGVMLHKKSTSTSVSAITMGSLDQVPTSVTPAAGATFKNVSYCNDGADGGQQTLDIYYPTEKFGSSLPVVIWIHGGGWHTGDSTISTKEWFPQGMLSNGIVLVSINYRLAPQYMYPAQEYDAQCAVAFVRENAAKLGINPNRIGVAGGSAGAHIASWLGVNQTSLYKVQAVGLISAPENISASYPSDAGWTQATSDAWDDNATLRYAGSPVNFVSANDPPYLILHGYNDTVVPYEQAVEMYNALKNVGAPVTLVLVNCAGHGLSPVQGCSENPPLSVVQPEMINFFVQQLG